MKNELGPLPVFTLLMGSDPHFGLSLAMQTALKGSGQSCCLEALDQPSFLSLPLFLPTVKELGEKAATLSTNSLPVRLLHVIALVDVEAEIDAHNANIGYEALCRLSTRIEQVMAYAYLQPSEFVPTVTIVMPIKRSGVEIDDEISWNNLVIGWMKALANRLVVQMQRVGRGRVFLCHVNDTTLRSEERTKEAQVIADQMIQIRKKEVSTLLYSEYIL